MIDISINEPTVVDVETGDNENYVVKENQSSFTSEDVVDVETGNNTNYVVLEKQKLLVIVRSAYEDAVKNGFVGTVKEWLESLKGADGKSAYDIAVKHGFIGSEEEWLESIKSPPFSCDSELSLDSENPVQNKIVAAALNGKAERINIAKNSDIDKLFK